MRIRWFFALLVLVMFPAVSWAAAYTTQRSGNWSVVSTDPSSPWYDNGAQTALAAVPGDGDTATVGHALTVDANTTVGTSGIEGTVAVTINAGSLTINQDVRLICRGGLTQNNTPLTLQAGAALEFDSSASAAPSTTSYKWTQGTTGTQTSASFTANGTSAKRCTVTSNPGGANAYHSAYAATGSGQWTVAFTDFTRFGGNGKANSFNLRPDTGRGLNIQDSTFTDLGSAMRTTDGGTAGNAANDFIFNRVYLNNVATGPSFDMYITPPTTGRREFTNCVASQSIRWQSTGGLKGWTLDGSIFNGGFSVISGPAGDIASAKNMVLIDNVAAQSAFSADLQGGTIEDFYFLNHTYKPTTSHAGGSINMKNISLLGGVVEGSTSGPNVLDLVALSISQDTVKSTYIKNTVFALAADGRSPVLAAQLKGTKNTRFTFENNTLPIAYDNISPETVYTSSGSDSRGYTGQIASFKNNLLWAPGTPLSGYSFGLTNVGGTSNQSGTAQGTSTTTVLNTTLTFLTGISSMEGYQVKMTSGPDAGLIRQVVSNTANSMTVSPAFPNTMASQTFTVFPVDQITAADYNASYGLLAEGSISDATLTNVTTAKRIYSGFALTNPATLGANDIVLPSLNFVDTDRGLYNFATKKLGNTAAPAFADATAYAAGQAVSRSVAGFYSNQSINYRAIVAHTSSPATAPGGYTNTTLNISAISATSPQVVTTSANHNLTTGACIRASGATVTSANGLWVITVLSPTAFALNGSYLGAGQAAGGTIEHNWRNYWEFEGLYELRNKTLNRPDSNANATQANLIAWMKEGYTPTNMTLATAGEGGAFIGAVQPMSTQSQSITHRPGFKFGPLRTDLLGF